MRNWKALLTGSTLGLGLLATAGCRIDTHKNGNHDDVKIATPFGGMSVKTDDDVVKQGVGLAVYPGATLVRKNNKNDGAADVNIGFGGFRLRVQALSYQTSDPPEKVMAFYRTEMARYGTVIQCKNNNAVGMPDHTPDGLTCERNHDAKVHVSEDDESGEELKAGSKYRQHIVGIDPLGSGTKIGLVAIELPSHLDDEKQ
jgi:hypothetical protein